MERLKLMDSGDVAIILVLFNEVNIDKGVKINRHKWAGHIMKKMRDNIAKVILLNTIEGIKER